MDEQSNTLCAFNGKYFTAGGTASQRSESVNSQIKERGNVRNQAKYNIFEYCNHINNTFDNVKASCIKEIASLVKNGKQWSKWVNDRWEEGSKLATNYDVNAIDCNLCEVQLKGVLTEHTRQVFVPTELTDDDDVCPTCTCLDYQTNLIICRHICFVFSIIKYSLWDERNLAKRWKLKFHPYYYEAMIAAGLMSAIPSSEIDVSTDIISSRDTKLNQALQIYNTINIPPKNLRYSKLMDLFKQINDYTSNDGHAFKVAYLSLNACLAQLRGHTNTEPQYLQAPSAVNIRGQGKKENYSILKQNNKRKRCKGCGGVGHQSNNLSCPNYKAK